ncbi:MAG: SPOR domain-containing protein [Gammaproteobacteria bacterium]|nr:SPOR domain-containing protein [Gammaproteobacteria bacterium]
MATKSKASQASKKTSTPAKPCRPLLAWCVGLAMGLGIAYWVHWEHTRPDLPAGSDTVAEDTATDPSATPRFEFYQLLTEQEVAIEIEAEGPSEAETGPETDRMSMAGDGALPAAEEEEAEEKEEAPAAPAGGTRYLLQAGSFQSAADADSLRARLAIIGIEANIQVVELPGGETWHRVRIGPYRDLRTVNEARARMAANQIEAIMLRAGG